MNGSESQIERNRQKRRLKSLVVDVCVMMMEWARVRVFIQGEMRRVG